VEFLDQDSTDLDADIEDLTETPEVEGAREWFDEDDDLSEEAPTIVDIVGHCLKAVKKINTPRAFKALMRLTTVIQYVELRDRYQKNLRCREPCVNASLAVARRVGKGPYFARQIRSDERYLLCHHRLPPSKKEGLHGHFTLLDNESVVLGVRKYLAAQALGSITPRELCRHVNEVICPALGFSTEKGKITERTAITWLRKLGYECVEVRKGLYHDGHERPDVVEMRKRFLGQMAQYERCDPFDLFQCWNSHLHIQIHVYIR
jgi:hypothetical protein